MPNRTFNRLTCLFFLPLLFTASVNASSSSTVNDMPRAGTDVEGTKPQDQDRVFRFNVSPNGYPPYIIVDDKGYSGIIWDVVSLISERLGYQLVAEMIPRKRVDQMLLENYIDGTPRAREWTEEPERFLFTDPIVRIEEVFFVPTESDFEYRTPEDLRSKTLVTHLGYNYPAIEPYFESGEVTRFDVAQDKEMFGYVLHGDRFDAAIADRLVGHWIILNLGMQGQLRSTRNSISDYGYCLMLRKDWQDFAKAFNRELKKLKDNGELEDILSRYR